VNRAVGFCLGLVQVCEGGGDFQRLVRIGQEGLEFLEMPLRLLQGARIPAVGRGQLDGGLRQVVVNARGDLAGGRIGLSHGRPPGLDVLDFRGEMIRIRLGDYHILEYLLYGVVEQWNVGLRRDMAGSVDAQCDVDLRIGEHRATDLRTGDSQGSEVPVLFRVVMFSFEHMDI
jgi:hypothetical protein